MTDILVVGDTTNGKLASATAELITAAGNIVGDIGVGLVGTSLQEAARVIKGHKVASGVKALAVPGSQQVRDQAIELGLDEIFQELSLIHI